MLHNRSPRVKSKILIRLLILLIKMVLLRNVIRTVLVVILVVDVEGVRLEMRSFKVNAFLVITVEYAWLLILQFVLNVFGPKF